MYEYKGWRVWRLNEYDWVCAKYFEDAVDWYMALTGEDFEDIVDESYADEMVDLNSTMRVEDNPNERISFKEVIDKEFEGKPETEEPWIIASTEW